MSNADCEVPQFYSHEERVARKAHKCCECTAPIEAGEKHFFVTGKWDGTINRYRQHFICEKACEYVRDNFQDFECLSYGALWEYFCDAKEWLREHKRTPDVKAFRSLIAQIRWRERGVL